MHQDLLDLLRAFIDSNVVVGAYRAHRRAHRTDRPGLRRRLAGKDTSELRYDDADVIGGDDFIKNKRATGRARDLEDVEALGAL